MLYECNDCKKKTFFDSDSDITACPFCGGTCQKIEAIIGQCSQCGKTKCTDLEPVDGGKFFICGECFKKRHDGSGGLKYDTEKLRTDLLSIPAMKATAKILTLGAKKYAERNWEAGMDFSRVYRACLSHLIDWFDGEDLDKDSGESHLDHAACCIMFLQHFVKNPEKYQKFDNRPNTEKPDEG